MKVPVLYQVDPLRDGRTFSTRRVTAIQHGRSIFHLSSSFQADVEGPSHQASLPEAPDPESLETIRERSVAQQDALPKEFVARMKEREHRSTAVPSTTARSGATRSTRRRASCGFERAAA